MAGNSAKQRQAKQNEQLLFSLARFNQDKKVAEDESLRQLEIEKKKAADQVAAEEANKKLQARKKAETPIARSTLVTSPFGLLSEAPTASRRFGL